MNLNLKTRKGSLWYRINVRHWQSNIEVESNSFLKCNVFNSWRRLPLKGDQQAFDCQSTQGRSGVHRKIWRALSFRRAWRELISLNLLLTNISFAFNITKSCTLSYWTKIHSFPNDGDILEWFQVVKLVRTKLTFMQQRQISIQRIQILTYSTYLRSTNF